MSLPCDYGLTLALRAIVLVDSRHHCFSADKRDVLIRASVSILYTITMLTSINFVGVQNILINEQPI